MNKIEILAIDDEPQILKLFQIIFENNGYRFTGAQNAQQGLQLAASNQPELIILDLGLPDKSGHEVLKELKQWYNKSIIILSAVNDEDDIVLALDNGATDYLTKPFRTAELQARIRAAVRRNDLENDESILKIGNLEINLVYRTVQKDGEFIKLTSTEYNLLSVFARNQGRVLTHQFLLREVWGINSQKETQYLRVFVGTLRKKIEDNPLTPQYIITENNIGYRFVRDS